MAAAKKAPNPIDKHVGSRVRMRRMMLAMSQEKLGDALGLSSVHTNRVLQELRAQGLVTFRSKAFSITSWDGLVRAAEFNPAYLQLAK